jgi:hypothetical protein
MGQRDVSVMNVQYAKIDRKSSSLASEFGLDWATKLFGAEALAELPRFSRGPRKGLLKGFVLWLNVSEGGWDPEAQRVVRPGRTARAWIAADYDGRQIVCGHWLGRVQPLIGDRQHMFAEGRARVTDELAEQARRAAEEKAELVDEQSGGTISWDGTARVYEAWADVEHTKSLGRFDRYGDARKAVEAAR